MMPKQTLIKHLINGRLLKGRHVVQEELWIAGGRIVAPQSKADVTIDLQGGLVSPGLIDLQINGAFGIDFTEEPERVHEVALGLPQFGVTAFLPTLITTSKQKYSTALTILRQAMHNQKEGEATILGVHLEGPFFNPELARAHPQELIQLPTEDVEAIYGNLEGVKMVTLAPEMAGGLKMISSLKKKSIVVSVGHSAASRELFLQAIENGLGCATHLFNAMPPFHHRKPGLVGAVLAHPTLPFTLIADPLHLDDEALQIAWSCGKDRCLLISDAMAGLGAEKATLGAQRIDLKQGGAFLAGTQTLAGSTQSLDSCLRHLLQTTHCTVAEAFQTVSYRPAQLLGLAHKGSLAYGCDADLIVWDETLNPQRCFIAGEEIKINKK